MLRAICTIAPKKESLETKSDKPFITNDAKENVPSNTIETKTLNKINPSKANYSINFQSIPNHEAKPNNLAAYQIVVS